VNHKGKLFILGLAIAASAFGAAAAIAADNKVFRFTYPVIIPARGSGDEVAGPGGARGLKGSVGPGFIGIGPEANDLVIQVLDDPVLCGVPAPAADGFNFAITWPSDCVNPTNFVIARFITSKGPITITRAYWANSVGDSIAPAIVEQLPAPAAGPWALAALMAGLVGAGVWMVRRRRAGAAIG